MDSWISDKLRRLADRLDGNEPMAKRVVVTPSTTSGPLARIALEYNDPDKALKALAVVTNWRFIGQIAGEIGASFDGGPDEDEEN